MPQNVKFIPIIISYTLSDRSRHRRDCIQASCYDLGDKFWIIWKFCL